MMALNKSPHAQGRCQRHDGEPGQQPLGQMDGSNIKLLLEFSFLEKQ